MSRLLAALLLLLFATSSLAAQRIIVLAPAAADIIKKLDAAELVVGKTRNVQEFPKAKKVGSHIRPNLEIITSLEPDLLIISSNSFFSQEMAEAVKAETLFYNPDNLEEILEQTHKLALRIDRAEQATVLIEKQREKLRQIRPVSRPPKVMYEISESPLTIAGRGHVLADMIESAGGEFITGGQAKMLRFNPEAVLSLQPDIYLWQVGPMNQNPTAPEKRGHYRSLNAEYLQVDQLQYSRANTTSFDNVLQLNHYFRERQ